MNHVLPALPYPMDALEPHIDARTMQVHHDGHHAAYVNNLNKALEGLPEQADWSAEDLLARLESVPDPVRTAVRNNAGGHVNHSLFWAIMAPKPRSAPKGELAAAVSGAFGSFDGFKEAFSRAALGVFGSGWAWLVLDKGGRLAIKGMPNQDSPILNGEKPVMGLDVWEHAYYLAYQNKRADYIKAWWNVVNWAAVEERWRTFSASGAGAHKK